MTPERKKALIAEALGRVEATLAGRLDALGERGLTLDEIEDLVEAVGREANAWLEGRLIAEQEPPPANRAPCPHCQQPAPYKETLHSRILTSHGFQTVCRRYYRCPACRMGFSPMDRCLDLGQGRTATRRVRAWLARLACAEGSFAAVPPLLADLRGLEVSESTVERTTVDVGVALADTYRAEAAAAAKALETDAAAAKALETEAGAVAAVREPEVAAVAAVREPEAAPLTPAAALPGPDRLYLSTGLWPKSWGVTRRHAQPVEQFLGN